MSCLILSCNQRKQTLLEMTWRTVKLTKILQRLSILYIKIRKQSCTAPFHIRWKMFSKQRSCQAASISLLGLLFASFFSVKSTNKKTQKQQNRHTIVLKIFYVIAEVKEKVTCAWFQLSRFRNMWDWFIGDVWKCNIFLLVAQINSIWATCW